MNIRDWRDITTGLTIPTEAGGYCDQPSLCELPDGGETRACGWQMINRYMLSAGYGKRARAGAGAESVRIYRQALTVTECVISQRNG